MRPFSLHDLPAEDVPVSLLRSGREDRRPFHFGAAVFRAGIRVPGGSEFRIRNATDFLVVLAGSMVVHSGDSQAIVGAHEGVLMEVNEPIALEFRADTLLLWGLYGEEIDFPKGAIVPYWPDSPGAPD